MKRAPRLLATALAAAMLASGIATAQEVTGPARNSVTLRCGYGFSAGDWNKVPYLPDVTMMAGRIMYGMNIEVRVSDRWTLAFDGGFENLDGGDWEAYANSRGDTLRVDASFFYAAVLLRPHLGEGGENLLRAEFGPAIVFPSGRERLNGRVYTYDFFSSAKVGGLVGLEYDRSINPWLGLSLRASALVAPAGVSYADGETRILIALPVTAGVRFYF